MIQNDEIIIDDNIIKEKEVQSKEIIEEKDNIKNNKNLNLDEDDENGIELQEIENENNKINENLIENENDSNNININNKINYDDNIIYKNDINNINNQKYASNLKEDIENKKIFSKSNKLNNMNLNDDIITSQTKEELIQQNLDLNNEVKNNNETKNNIVGQLNKNNNKTIDENEDYQSIEKILNYKDKNINQRNEKQNNFNKNNKLYFTETNIEDLQSKKEIQKLGNMISSIPEYSKNFKFASPNKSLTLQIAKALPKMTKNSINLKLNNLSPQIYMKKKYVNKYNFHPLQYRIKKIEEEIEKQNIYDFERVMKDIQLKYDKEKKNKEKEKHIFEHNKKLEEKLKYMEEKRNILLEQKLQQILKKQHKYNKKNKQNNDFENSHKNNNQIDTISYNNEKLGKLPPLQNTPKYELIKMIKEKREEQFCYNTIKKLKENEIVHRKNYLKHLNIINEKINNHTKLYKQRSENCIIANKKKLIELEENYIEKEIRKRYNIKQTILRENSAKKDSNFKILKSIKQAF